MGHTFPDTLPKQRTQLTFNVRKPSKTLSTPLAPRWTELKPASKRVCSVGEDVGKQEPCALLVGMHDDPATTDNSVVAPQKMQHRITLWSSSSLWEYIYKEELKPGLKQIFAHQCPQKHYSQ